MESHKKPVAEIQKYFNPDNDQHLRNRYSTRTEHSSIKTTFIPEVRAVLPKDYEISDNEMYDKCQNIKVDKDPDVRYYACVVDKNRAGPKPTVLFELNLAYNRWEEQGYLKLKDQFNDLIDKPED